MAETRYSPKSHSQLVSPMDLLASEPYKFDFFQAVRILAWAARDTARNESSSRHPVGHDFSPSDEVIRFQSDPSLGYPAAAIDDLSWPQGDRQEPPKMRVTFLGLFGPHGVLPRHYTQLIIDRTRKKDTALRDFLDLFNHRMISLFWRAWAKHRLPIAFEESQRDRTDAAEDQFTTVLYSLVGLGGRAARDRLEVPDPAFLFFAGHFSHVPPQAVTLEAIVMSYCSVDACVQQFRGQWLQLDQADQSRLSGTRLGQSQGQPANNQLGHDTVVGQRVWSIENRFRIRLGPLSYRQFESFTPAGRQQVPLAQLVRNYVGPEYDFDVQLVLRRDEVPAARLAPGGQPPTCRLGWNSWISSRPFTTDADDATFTCEGLPTRG